MAKKYYTGDAVVWRYLTRNRYEVERQITWIVNAGKCSLWWDNWLGDGALANYCDNVSS